MNIGGTTVTGTVLAAPEFRNFYALVMMLPALTFREYVTYVPYPSLYFTDLFVER